MTDSDQDVSLPRRDWRNPNDYVGLRHVSREALAWEFLRRNLDYRNAAAQAKPPRHRRLSEKRPVFDIQVSAEHREAGRWGLLYFRRPR